MAKCNFAGSYKVGCVLSALLAALMLMTGCNEPKADNPGGNEPKVDQFPGSGLPGGPIGGPIGEGLPPPPVLNDAQTWVTIPLMVRINPRHPEDEQFLGDWRVAAHNIDDQARPLGPTWFGMVGPDGTTALGVPGITTALPIEVFAYNEAYPFRKGHSRHCRHHREHRDPVTEIGPVADGAEAAVDGAGEAEDGAADDAISSEADVDASDADALGFSGHRCASCDDECFEDDHCKKHHGCSHSDCNDCRKKQHECRSFSIFIPPYCFDKAVWMVGPVEDAVWDYYRRAARHRGEAWNTSQVDCGTWLADLQLLILTDRVSDELDRESERGDNFFNPAALRQAFQENQQLLVPTRPPICMATNFHDGGTLREDKPITLPVDLAPGLVFNTPPHNSSSDAPVIIGTNAVVDDICGILFDGVFTVNGVNFNPTANFTLDSKDFLGSVSEQFNTLPNLDVTAFNVRLGNGRPLDNDVWSDACALSNLIRFTNNRDDDRDLDAGTGTYFTDLYGPGAANAVVVAATSDGDKVVDDNDTWAILHAIGDLAGEEQVIAVELLGHRNQDFRDALHMVLSPTDNLFLGLRTDYDIDDAGVDGELAFLGYTLSVWNGSTQHGRDQVRQDISSCYEAADAWAREFFVTQAFDGFSQVNDCCFNGHCKVECTISPLRAAEFAVRSQCFSNSRANARWMNDQAAFWNISSVKGAEPNVVVNPGWLAPNLDFYLYIQKFDEAVFKGPRTIVRTDCQGQLLTAIPTLVEGDRVLLKAIDSCCSDYDLVLPCVPEFTGWAGAPGIPYIPQTIGPPPPIGGPGPAPVVGPIGPGLLSPPIGPGGPGPGGPGGPVPPVPAPGGLSPAPLGA